MTQNTLEIRDINKGFNGVPVLKHVNLDVCPGEVHALCGENGAGKPTLMKVLSGVYPYGQYDGTIIFDGKGVQFRSIKDSEAPGIGIIHQELALVPYLSIVENIFLDAEESRKLGLINWHEVNHRAEKVLEKVGLNENVTTQVGTLGVGKQQFIEIDKAPSKDVCLLILDRPIAALSDNDSAQLLDLVRSLRDQGVAVVVISHKLGEIAKIANRTMILRDGQTIDTIDMKDPAPTRGKIIPLMISRDLTQRYLECSVEIGKEVFRVGDWIVYHPTQAGRVVISGASFDMRHGEVVGIAGLMGAGHAGLAMSIFGRSFGTRTLGKLLKDGKEITVKSVSDTVKYGIAYATEDRKQYGLNLIDDIQHNVATAGLFKFLRRGPVDGHKELAVAADYKRRMNIRSNSALQKIGSLSGGNQQKVVLSKWLYTDADVLILDEPTRGIDVGAKLGIYTLINKMVEKDKAVIVISSELEEILGVSDRIHTLAYGRITGEVKAEDATQENLMESMTIEPVKEEQK